MSKPTIPLLPCPWCGSEKLETAEIGEDSQDVSIRCKDCGACGPSANCFEEAAAVAAWNKGPYADRLDIHAAALKAHAEELRAKAEEHLAKADELLAKAAEASA